MKRLTFLIAGALMLFLAGTAGASQLRLDGAATQGGLLVGRTDPGSKVLLDGKPIRVSKGGLFLVGFGRDAEPHAEILVRHADGTEERHALNISKRKYKIQRINGLPKNLVVPSKRELERIRAEAKVIHETREEDSAATYFSSGFAWPADGRISGTYGTKRILNGEPRAPHLGLDIAAPDGAPVRAAADGVVLLAYRDMLLNGNVVIIDHGQGLKSTYIHLSRIDVKVGQKVTKGMRIGLIGHTGRATGPHLHWEVSLFETKLDPALLVPRRKSK